jgi:hypothetical protein
MSFDTTGLIGPQPQHAERLFNSLETNGLSWDGSATGTGKTYIAATVLRNRGKKFVVICPKLAIPQWREVLSKFGLTAEFIINFEKLARGNTPHYKWISQNKYRKLHKIANDVEIPEFVRAMFKFPIDWDVVVDESHKCKGVESLNAGMLFNLKRQGYKFHLMSATQATTPLDMRAFGYVNNLHDGSMRAYKKFAEDSGAKWVGKWGAQYFDSGDPESMAKLHKVHEHLFDITKVGSRLTRKDMIDIFPASQVVAEAYDMGTASDQIQSVYDEMEAELDLLEERCENYKEHILAVITKARRTAEMLKVPTMIDMVSDYHAEGRSSVIFVNYTDTILALVARIEKEFGKGSVGQIYGGRSTKDRLSDITEFNADKKLFMVANLAAGGSCINLHDLIGNRGRSSLINPSYSAISVLQSAGRIDRVYAKTDVYQRFLYAARTIEENVLRRFHDKNCFITALNDGTLTDADLIPTERLFKFARGMNV